MYINYLSPCEGHTSIFRMDPSKRVQTTYQFETWCAQFTNSILERGLALFCDRTDTNLELMAPRPSSPWMGTRIGPNKSNLTTLSIAYASLPTLDLPEVRLKRHINLLTRLRKKRSSSREPRVIAELLTLATGAALGYIGYSVFGVGSNVANVTEPKKINELIKTSHDNIETTDILKGAADKYLEEASKNSELIKNIGIHLRDLNTTSDPRTQAIVSTLVFRFLTIEQELRKVANVWNYKKQIHPALFDAFKITRTCVEECPTALTATKVCTFNPVTKQFFAAWRQTVVNPNFVLEADPFEFKYEVKDYFCRVPFIGPRYVVEDSEDCIRAIITTNRIGKLVYPLLGKDCIERSKLWGTPKCYKDATVDDKELTEVKLVDDNVYFRCRGQYLNNGIPKACPNSNSTDIAIVPLSHNLTIGGLELKALNRTMHYETNFNFNKEYVALPDVPTLSFNISDLEEDIEELKRFKNDSDQRYRKVRERIINRLQKVMDHPVTETSGMIAGIWTGALALTRRVYTGVINTVGSFWASALAIMGIYLAYKLYDRRDEDQDNIIINTGTPMTTIRQTSGRSF